MDVPDARSVRIHQAIGMVAAQLEWPVADAFKQLRVYAVASGGSLEEAARDVLDGAVAFGKPESGAADPGEWVTLTRTGAVPATVSSSGPAGLRPVQPVPCAAIARPRFVHSRFPARTRRSHARSHSWVRAV